MSPSIPEFHEILEIKQETPLVKSFVFKAKRIAKLAKPGQFVMVWLPGVDEIPISIAHVDRDEGLVELAIAKVGDCTSRIHELSESKTLGLRGPFGNGFTMNENMKKVWMVAGGYGSAPLRFLAETLIDEGKELVVFLGARSKVLLLYPHKFKELGCEVKLATDDGSAGMKGFVTELVEKELRKYKPDVIFTCGPEIMMKKVCELAIKYDTSVQASVERIVKCAHGACGACDIGGFRVCKDGPVFDGKFLIERTEFGRWKREKSGKRVEIISGAGIASAELEELKPKYDEMLTIELFDLRFPNPLMNASGFGVSGMLLYRYAKHGAGAIVTKSIGMEERKGFANPTFLELESGTFVNAMGLPNPGIDNYELEIKDAKKANVPIIVSIFGQSPEEVATVGRKAVEFGADMLEINVSCPHTEISSVENDPELVKQIVEEVKKVVKDVTVSVKLSPNTDYIEVAKAAEEGGADAITAINTLRVKPEHPQRHINILGNPSGFGGRSGKKHAEIGKKVVYEIYREVNIPLIGVGGISAGKDVVEYAGNGASLFQIGSALVSDGLGIFNRIKNEIKEYLKNEGYSHIKELVGENHTR